MRAASPNSCAAIRGSNGLITPALPIIPITLWRGNISAAALARCLTFGIVGGLEAGKAFYDALKLFKRLVNMGDAKSLACHPASTTHRQMSAQEQDKAGVRPEMIRLSVGIEHIDDILADLDQALAASQSRRASPLLAAE